MKNTNVLLGYFTYNVPANEDCGIFAVVLENDRSLLLIEPSDLIME